MGRGAVAQRGGHRVRDLGLREARRDGHEQHRRRLDAGGDRGSGRERVVVLVEEPVRADRAARGRDARLVVPRALG